MEIASQILRLRSNLYLKCWIVFFFFYVSFEIGHSHIGIRILGEKEIGGCSRASPCGFYKELWYYIFFHLYGFQPCLVGCFSIIFFSALLVENLCTRKYYVRLLFSNSFTPRMRVTHFDKPHESRVFVVA